MNRYREPVSHRLARRARRILLLFMALTALWLLALSRVYVNASWSDDAWGFLLVPLAGDPRPGQQVLFEPPAALDSPIPFLKTVRGLPGDAVTVDAGRTVRVNGAPVGVAKTRARDGRPLALIAPGTIPPGHFFLFADHPDSHDSRYAEIGLVPRARILGRAEPLPNIPWLGLKGPLVGPEEAGPFSENPARTLP